MRDLKYLVAYIAPLAAFLGIWLGGWWSLGSIYVAFVALPLLELILPLSTTNFSPEEETERSNRFFFDLLLYLNLPILLLLLWYFFSTIAAGGVSPIEQIGLTLNVGLIVGTIGINVAHELGHRSKKYEQWMSQILLTLALYTHFYIEHNRGHHKHVSTDLDPASARRGEWLYLFWIRSMTGGYRNAWKLEAERLRKAGKSPLHYSNLMIRFTAAQLVYLGLVGWLFGPLLILFALGVALVGILLLESVNYIEHYGLRRQKTSGDRYEPVSPRHSWNSDHELGRIFLYELTRHSDHHYKATRKYQVLRHFDESPQLPLGYPGSILLALLPPVWVRVMEKELEKVGN